MTEYHLKEENAMSQPDTFVIVDGNSLMHRAFHALPPLSNADGVFTNAVFGFLSMLFKVICIAFLITLFANMAAWSFGVNSVARYAA